MSGNRTRIDKKVSLPPAMWKLFNYALISADCEALKAGEKRLTSSDVISAIVLKWLVDNEHDIRTAFYDCSLEVAEGGLPAFHTTDYLLAIASAAGAEVPELCRVGRSTPTARRAREAEVARSVRGARGRPAGTVLRANGRPIPVRGGSSDAGPADGEWPEALFDLVFGRENPPRPSDIGLGKDPTPEAEEPIPHLVKVARSYAA